MMQNKHPVALGLHITKCAGTSLISTLRHAMPEEEYYFFSSYFENFQCSRPTFYEIVERDRLRICFGHYLHEDFLKVFEGRGFFLFTGLRDPVRRAVSDFRQVNAVRFRGGQDPVAASDYVATNPGTMCLELLRAFPSIASGGYGETWERALQILCFFDYVYQTESFADDVQSIFAFLNLRGLAASEDNVSSSKQFGSEFRAEVESEVEKLMPLLDNYLNDDLQLCDVLKSTLGHGESLKPFNPRSHLRGLPYYCERDALLRGIDDPQACMERIAELEVEYLVYEHSLLGRLDFLSDMATRRRAFQDRILDRVEDYTS